MDDEPIGHLPRHLGHQRAERAQQYRRRAERVGAGIEHGCHQGVAVVLTGKIQPAAVLPAGENGFQRLDVFAHARRRVTELDTEAVLDMRFYLGTDPEQEAALAERLQVPGLVGQVHGIARESHCDAGGDIQLRRMFAGQRQRQEGIPAALQCVYTVVADGGEAGGLGRGAAQLRIERAINFHAASSSMGDHPENATRGQPAR